VTGLFIIVKIVKIQKEFIVSWFVKFFKYRLD